jgi:trans-2,3-dihydro-3-hydroxyanthranilate isomerase
MKHTFQIVDVFGSTPFGGNQLAIVPDAAGISTEGKQKIAREFNFGESAFVLPQSNPASTFRVRIFTIGQNNAALRPAFGVTSSTSR